MSMARPVSAAVAPIAHTGREAPRAPRAAEDATRPSTIVRRRPTRSASQPPSGCDTIDPAPKHATTTPAVVTDRSRPPTRYRARNGWTNCPSRLTIVPAKTTQNGRGRPSAVRHHHRRARAVRSAVGGWTGVVTFGRYALPPTVRQRIVAGRRRGPSRSAASALAEAERVPGRVEEDAEGSARLVRVPHRAELEDRSLGRVEIVDGDVEVRLLGSLLARPVRRAVVLDPLEADRLSVGRGHLGPVAVVLGGPAEEAAVERGHGAGVGAVEDEADHACDRHARDANNHRRHPGSHWWVRDSAAHPRPPGSSGQMNGRREYAQVIENGLKTNHSLLLAASA